MKREGHSFEVNSIIVLILTVIANVLGVVFQSLSGHLLNDTKLYADLNAVMALFNILVLPTTVASYFISKNTAQLYAQQSKGKIKFLLLGATKVLGIFSIVFGVLMFSAHEIISIWLNIEDSTVIVLAITLVLLTLFSAIFTGSLQGSQSFLLYGFFGLIGPVYKIVAIVFSTFNNRKLVSILAVWIIGTIISYVIGFFLVKKILGNSVSEHFNINGQQARRDIIKLLIANAGVILLSNIDVLIVKHSFNNEAGLYSAARMIAYSITYFANAFVVVLFPSVAEGTKNEVEKLRLLKRTLVYYILLSFVVTVCLILFFDLGIKILLGNEYLACKQYLIPVLIYILPIGIINVLANYSMANGKTAFITCTLFLNCGCAIVCGLVQKNSLIEYIYCIGMVMWIIVLCNIVNIYGKDKLKDIGNIC